MNQIINISTMNDKMFYNNNLKSENLEKNKKKVIK